MTHLSDAQLVVLQRYVDKARAELDAHGLTVTVEEDFRLWVDEMGRAPAIASISTTFDPRYSSIDHRNGFWLAFREDTGRLAACICSKLFRNTNAIDLIRSQHLFFDRLPRLDFRPAEVALDLDAPLIMGDLAYIGGLWIHPEYRGKKLSRTVPHIHKALALRHFDPDWQFGLIRNTPGRVALAQEGYGVDGSFACIDGYFPPQGREARYRISYSSRHQVVHQVLRELEPERLTAEAAS